MNDSLNPLQPEQIDSLVRFALEADAAAVELPALVARIKAQQGQAGHVPQPSPGRAPGAWGWRIALAACLFLAIGFAVLISLPARAVNAYSLVNSAHEALARDVDRSYDVELDLPNSALRMVPLLHRAERMQVWTRGDRFRVELLVDGQVVDWGQDEQSRVWMVYDPQHGLLFEQRDLLPEVARSVSYLSLDAYRLTGEILSDFDLEVSGKFRDITAVRATLKKGLRSPHFQIAEMEIDRETKIIRRLELRRLANQREETLFVFRFVAEQPQSDESYRLESHLDPGAKVLGRENNRERMRLFSRLMKRAPETSPVPPQKRPSDS